MPKDSGLHRRTAQSLERAAQQSDFSRHEYFFKGRKHKMWACISSFNAISDEAPRVAARAAQKIANFFLLHPLTKADSEYLMGT